MNLIQPDRPQFRPHKTRSHPINKRAVVLHTAEMGLAHEVSNLREFIEHRADAGSYHVAVDITGQTDYMIPWDLEAFHASARGPEGQRANDWAYSLAFVFKAKDWPVLTHTQRARAVEAAARSVAGLGITPVQLTADEFWSGKSGFIGHGDIQDNRHDPGPDFPWGQFLAATSGSVSPEDFDSETPEDDNVAWLQEALREAGFAPGPVDGVLGPLTRTAANRALKNAQQARRLKAALDSIE